MADKNQIYKCLKCGIIIETIHSGKGILSCCGEEMHLLDENTTDAAREKHVPAVEKLEKGISVQVGEVPHPMEEKHFIEWIQIIYPDGSSERKFLAPGQEPAALFPCAGDGVYVREYCNLHGLWKKA